MNSDELPVNFHKIPQKFGPYVQKIVDRCWLNGNVGSDIDDAGNVTFMTSMPDDTYQYVMERAQMEWLNQKSCFKDFFLISENENKRIFWLAATKEFLGTENVIFLSEKEIKKYTGELEEELKRKTE